MTSDAQARMAGLSTSSHHWRKLVGVVDSGVRGAALSMPSFLAIIMSHSLRPADRQFEPLFEIAIQQELYEILVTWLKHVSLEVPVGKETRETTALVISWAIFVPAAQWSRGDQTISAEEMTHHVLAVVMAGLSPIVIVT